MAFLRDNRFIDRHTRVLLVTLNTYNMNAEAWSVMTFQADLPPTGGTVMTVRYESAVCVRVRVRVRGS